MQISMASRVFLAALLGAALITGIVLFTTLGTAGEQPKETRRSFALNSDASLVAYHFSQASADGGLQRGIRVHEMESGAVLHVIQGKGSLQVHSPAFDVDGRLIAGTICWSDTCPNGLSGSRLISINLGNGQWQVLTDDGYQTPFWEFGYASQTPGSVAVQAMRSDPVLTAEGIYYLISAANVREVTTARDFAPRRLQPNDGYVLAGSGTVGFRGRGSMAAFGSNGLLIVAGPARGGTVEATSRDDKTFAYLVGRSDGAILQTWTTPRLKKIGISAPPSPRIAAGDTQTEQGFVAASRDVIRLTPGGADVFHQGGNKGPRIHDIALSGDGRTLLVATRRPDQDVPMFDYFTIDVETRTREDFQLDALGSSESIIQIQ